MSKTYTQPKRAESAITELSSDEIEAVAGGPLWKIAVAVKLMGITAKCTAKS